MNSSSPTTPATQPASPVRKLYRRDFLIGVAAGAGLALGTGVRAAVVEPRRVALGLDAHAVRGMRWQARQLIEHAGKLKLDTVLLNTLRPFESLEPAHLRALKDEAAARGVRIYIGVGGVSEGSTTFSKEHGSAGDLLALGVRVATAVGSPVVNCRIGALPDRSTPGGIEARMEEIIRVIKAVRSRARDAGVKFAVENHAADLRSEEVLQIIEAAGTDLTGVMLDPGNAVWAMEDPMHQLELLGRHVLCTSVRDWMVWEAPDGALFQWTAIGEGQMDVPRFVSRMAALCPEAPLHLETISNSQRPIPFLKPEHWDVYPRLRAADLVPFLALCRRGRPLEVELPPPGVTPRDFDQKHQHAELERSIASMRRHGAGRKA